MSKVIALVWPKKDKSAVKPIKTIDQIPQEPMDAYQAAMHMFGKDDAKYALLTAREMRKAGWKFVDYNLYGEEVFVPPA